MASTVGSDKRLLSDGEGNLTQRVTILTGDTRVLSYDHRNRPVEVKDHAGGLAGDAGA